MVCYSKKLGLGFLMLLISLQLLKAQNNRINDPSQISWHAFFMNYVLDDKWSLHGEFQWRRTDFTSNPQQNLYRTGLNFKVNSSVTLRFGYLYADTFNYAQIPLNTLGMEFPEHRIYQMVTLNNPVGKVQVYHRFMLEQRWVGTFSTKILESPDDYVYLNRVRYMARIEISLKGKSIVNKTPYFAAYDELMIGFGKNVNQNIFDQNRIGILTGYRFSDHIRLEGGYFNQIAQLGRLVDGKNVFQGNRGYIVNTYFNF